MKNSLTRRDFLKLTGLGVSGAAAAFALAACAQDQDGAGTADDAGAAGTNQTNGTSQVESDKFIKILVGTNLDPGNIEPTSSAGAKMMWGTCIYENLATRVGFGGDLVLNLAKSYTQVDEYTYDIELHDNIYDNEGNHITAADVEYIYDYYKTSGTVSKMGTLDSMTATGEYTCQMVLNSLAVGVFETQMQRTILSKTAFEACGQKMTDNAVGTGPYVVKEFAAASYITLEKRDDYWQTNADLVVPPSRAVADEMTIQTIGSTSQLVIALQSGQIDGIGYMSGKDATYFLDDSGNALDGYFVKAYKDNNTYQMFFNMHEDYPNAANTSLELRQAIFKCIDPEGILYGVLDGLGELTHDWSNSLFSDYNPKWDEEDYFDYDPEAAKALVAKSGYKGESLRLACYNVSPWKEMAEAIQGYANKIGVNLELVTFDQPQVSTYLKDPTSWDIFLLANNSPDYIVNSYTHYYDARSYNGTTRFFYRDEKLQQLLETCASIEGHTQENVDAFHDYLKSVAVGRGICVQNYYSIWRDGILDIYQDANNYPKPTAFTFAEDWKSVSE